MAHLRIGPEVLVLYNASLYLGICDAGYGGNVKHANDSVGHLSHRARIMWVRLDVGFPRHPKVTELSVHAKFLFVTALCYVQEGKTDGRIKPRALTQLLPLADATQAHIDELIGVGLFEQHEDGVTVHHFLEYNPSAEELEEKRHRISTIRADAGQKGGRARVSKSSKQPSKRSSKTPSKTQANDSSKIDPTLPLDPLDPRNSQANQANGQATSLETGEIGPIPASDDQANQANAKHVNVYVNDTYTIGKPTTIESGDDEPSADLLAAAASPWAVPLNRQNRAFLTALFRKLGDAGLGLDVESRACYDTAEANGRLNRPWTQLLRNWVELAVLGPKTQYATGSTAPADEDLAPQEDTGIPPFDAMRTALRSSTPAAWWNEFVGPLWARPPSHDVLEIICPNDYVREWMDSRYGSVLADAVHDAGFDNLKLRFTVYEEAWSHA